MYFKLGASLSQVMSDEVMSIEAKLVFSKLYSCYNKAYFFNQDEDDVFDMACSLMEFAVNLPNVVNVGFPELIKVGAIYQDPELDDEKEE